MFILNIVWARMLPPEVFGLIGMIIVFFAIAQVMIEGGLGQAYVQKKNVTKADASTIFYVNSVVSLLLYIILFFAAPLIARFYERNELILLIRGCYLSY